MKFENTEVYNIGRSIYSARNPKDSWDRSDTDIENNVIGENDMKLAQTLIKAGKEHRKFLRQIMICVDITAPRYWWTEFDTYKIGTTANSCSTMHKLDAYPISPDMFEIDEVFDEYDSINYIMADLERFRKLYNETKDMKYFRAMKQRLPESFLQKRTMTLNYENIYEMIRQRSKHRLIEWSEETMNWIKELPYASEFFFEFIGVVV